MLTLPDLLPPFLPPWQQLHGPHWCVDLRLPDHSAAGAGLPLLLGHELRAVPCLPGEVGAGRTLAAAGPEPVEGRRQLRLSRAPDTDTGPDPGPSSGPDGGPSPTTSPVAMCSLGSRAWGRRPWLCGSPLLPPQTQQQPQGRQQPSEPHAASPARCKRLVSQQVSSLRMCSICNCWYVANFVLLSS